MFPAWLLRCLLVASASTFLAAQDSGSSGTSTITDKPSVLYIESTILGNFFVATGKALNDSDVDWSFEVQEACVCRFLCLRNESCMAVSSEVSDNGYLCKFAVLGPLNTTVDTVSVEEATYVYRHASLAGKTWGFQKDKLYYFEMPEWKTFADALESCRRIPGFRLPIIGTKTVMMNLVLPTRAYWLDLHKKPGGILEWGNSTRFTNPENIAIYFNEPFTSTSTEPFMRPVFYVYMNYMRDQILSNLERAVCQANPLGVDW